MLAFASLFIVLGTALFVFVLPVVLTVLSIQYARSGRRPPALVPALVLWAGFWTGGLVCWSLVSTRWSMPFWHTLAASVNSEKYGHVLEHQAENILFFVLLASVCTALLSWGVTWLAGRLRLHYN